MFIEEHYSLQRYELWLWRWATRSGEWRMEYGYIVPHNITQYTIHNGSVLSSSFSHSAPPTTPLPPPFLHRPLFSLLPVKRAYFFFVHFGGFISFHFRMAPSNTGVICLGIWLVARTRMAGWLAWLRLDWLVDLSTFVSFLFAMRPFPPPLLPS